MPTSTGSRRCDGQREQLALESHRPRPGILPSLNYVTGSTERKTWRTHLNVLISIVRNDQRVDGVF